MDNEQPLPAQSNIIFLLCGGHMMVKVTTNSLYSWFVLVLIKKVLNFLVVKKKNSNSKRAHDHYKKLIPLLTFLRM